MTSSEKWMNTANTENWTDDDGEVRELTKEDFARTTPFDKLPEELKKTLRQVKHATIKTNSVKKPVSISTDVVARFEATGEGWESRVDGALRQWLDEHPLEVEHAKAS